MRAAFAGIKEAAAGSLPGTDPPDPAHRAYPRRRAYPAWSCGGSEFFAEIFVALHGGVQFKN